MFFNIRSNTFEKNALFLQSVDRIHRLGLPPDAHVEVHLLLATLDGQPTIDHLVDAALNRKQARMQTLLEGAEITPLGVSDALSMFRILLISSLCRLIASLA